MTAAFLGTAALLVGSASAHTIFQQVYVDGQDQGWLTGVRVVENNGPIFNASANDIICNGVQYAFHQPPPKDVIDVPAGAELTAEWHLTLNKTANAADPTDPCDHSHKGPMITYLAKIPDATQADVTGLQWFKIDEDGLKVDDQSWGLDRMVANKGNVTFKIPECIEDGQYLLRHELIALHTAQKPGGAQFFLECAQLNIKGGSASKTPETVSFPGAYKEDDPGLVVDIYQPLDSYTPPGPAVFTCS
ncbi:glycoside hydrolase family 61 protein [Trametes elegans]|nr:glycoside hydrolase family 61 protein [Trametes elegans]